MGPAPPGPEVQFLVNAAVNLVSTPNTSSGSNDCLRRDATITVRLRRTLDPFSTYAEKAKHYVQS
eukprot:12129962-Karenia_brevis.AAC.1